MNNEQSKKEIRIRGYVAAVFTVITAAITIAVCIMGLKTGKSGFGECLEGGLIAGLVLGGCIPGFTHIKTVFNKIKVLLYFPFVGWAAWLVLILLIPYGGGFVFMFKDLIKFLKLRKESE